MAAALPQRFHTVRERVAAWRRTRSALPRVPSFGEEARLRLDAKRRYRPWRCMHSRRRWGRFTACSLLHMARIPGESGAIRRAVDDALTPASARRLPSAAR